MQIEYVKLLLVRPEASFEAALCIVDLDLPEIDNQSYSLHKDELVLYRSLLHQNRKLSYLSGRIAAKTAVSILTGTVHLSSILIDIGVFNHPVVKVPDISGVQVSISHCQNIGLALAFPEAHPMGIDIEQIDETKVEAFNDVITLKEKHLIDSCGLEFLVGATVLWSAKESLSKIFKTGFTTSPQIFEINKLTCTDAGYLCTFTNFIQYKVYAHLSDSYVYSIALPLNTNTDLQKLNASFGTVVQKL